MDNQMKFVTVELKKFDKQEEACTTDLDKLIFTMKALSNAQQPPTQYPKFWTEEWLKAAIQELDTRAMTADQRMAYEMTLAYNAEVIRQEKEKIAQAKLEGKIETAQQLISLGMTDEFIATALKQTLEFVQNIRLDMAKAASAEQKMA